MKEVAPAIWFAKNQFPAATSPRIRALPNRDKAPPAEFFAPLRTTGDSQADVGRRRVFFGRLHPELAEIALVI